MVISAFISACCNCTKSVTNSTVNTIFRKLIIFPGITTCPEEEARLSCYQVQWKDESLKLYWRNEIKGFKRNPEFQYEVTLKKKNQKGAEWELASIDSQVEKFSTGLHTGWEWNGKWKIISFQEDDMMFSLENLNWNVELQTKTKMLQGKLCNIIHGEVHPNGEKLQCQGIVSTKMACPENMLAENKIILFLQKENSWKREGNILKISHTNAQIILQSE